MTTIRSNVRLNTEMIRDWSIVKMIEICSSFWHRRNVGLLTLAGTIDNIANDVLNRYANGLQK